MTGSRQLLAGALAATLFIAACGSSTSYSSSSRNVTRFATGPIYSACLASERRAANRSLCGCIQASADRTLSGSDQRRAQSFFRDPQIAHDVKYSQSARDDSFWDRYKVFAESSERSCRGL